MYNKLPGGKKEGLLNLIPTPQRPFARIHLDHCGPLPTSSRAAKHILVMTDAFTRLIQLHAVKDTKTEHTIKAIETTFAKFGYPQIIITDRGTSFTSTLFQEYCENKGIRHVLNSPRHPQANGVCERTMRTLIPTLRSRLEDDELHNWTKIVPDVERALNLAKNTTTGFSPFEALFGYQPTFDQSIIDRLADTDEEHPEHQTIWTQMKLNIARAEGKYKARYDATKRTPAVYEVGDVVLIRRNPVATGESTKLQPKFKGPFTIIKALPSDTYVVGDLPTSNRAWRSTAHVSQLRRYLNADADHIVDKSDSESSDVPDVEEHQIDGEDVEATNDDDVEATNDDDVEAANTTTCERRQRRPPAYLRDYV